MSAILKTRGALSSWSRELALARHQTYTRVLTSSELRKRSTADDVYRCHSVAAERRDLCEVSAQHEPASARLVSIEDGAYTVEGAINTSASIGEVWEVLTAFDSLQNVFSNIRESSICSSSPETVLLQECKWEFLIFSGSFSAELAVKEERAAGRLTFRLIKSSFMDSFVGRWKMRENPGGGCSVEHKLTVVPKISPPAFMESYTQRIFVKQVAKILQDLDQELGLRDSDDYGSIV